MSNKNIGSYGIGLDIGVGSVGWAAIDVHSRLLRLQGKTGNGVRLFEEGRTAEDRRLKRGARRNHHRKKRRLRELDRIFAPSIRAEDPDFFQRRKYANRKHHDRYPNRLFHDISDRDFRKRYPTDYHLRKAIMDHPEHKFDIREIYLALHHIVKNRGNFLMSGSAQDFSVNRIDWGKELTALTDRLGHLYPDREMRLDPTYLADVRMAFLTQDIVARLAKENRDADKKVDFTAAQQRLQQEYPDLAERLAQSSILQIEDLQKTGHLVPMLAKYLSRSQEPEVQNVFKALVRAILGNDFNVNDLLNVPDEGSPVQVSIEDWDDHISEVSPLMEEVEAAGPIIDTIKKLHATIILKRILSDSHSISEHMVRVYQNKLEQDRGRASNDHPGNIKQRTTDNGALPYQLHQSEMDTIIANQGKYYPFLQEPNPVISRRHDFPYKLDELVGFKIPYYVGTLVGHDQSPFAWMVRKDDKDRSAITPWNFYDKIDLVATSKAFMERLKTTDNTLLGEPVLAKNTLLYQDYCVLDELNKVKIRNWDTGSVHKLTVAEKQGIYRTCFLAKKTVRATDVIRYIQTSSNDTKLQKAHLEVIGLSERGTFRNGLTTYRDLRRIYGDRLDEWLSDAHYRREFDHVIELASTFQDSNVFLEQLRRLPYPFLAGKRAAWSHHLYQGWGRLSARLLDRTKSQQDESVMDLLWGTNDNLMQIINRDDFQSKIEAHNQSHIQHHGVRRTIHDMYTSPQNKRAILQSILVIKDITRARGRAPDWVFLETARDTRGKSYQPQSRLARLKNQDRHLAPEVRKHLSSLGKKDRVSERQLLYFQQNGQDMYDTDQRLDWDHLSQYDIDHVLPRSLVKDDSLDNRVLTSKRTNAMKGNTQFAKEVSDGPTIQSWKHLLSQGLISNRKYDNLTLTEASFDRRINEFTARQLVETRQIIKLVAKMVAFEYPRTEVINVKAGLSHDFREAFDFPKDRDVNDYHHAFDAYLAGMIGNYFRRRSNYWHRFISNDDYNRQFASNPRAAARMNDKRSLNFIYQMKHSLYRDRNHSPIIYDDSHRHVIWNKQRDLGYLHSVYNNPRILVTHRTYERHGALFDETRIPADQATGKTIPLKEGFPVQEYGGYKSVSFAYYILVQEKKAQKKNTKTFIKMLSIPVQLDIKMKQAPTHERANQLLMGYIRSKGMTKKDYAQGATDKYRFHPLRDSRGHIIHVRYEQTFEYQGPEGGPYWTRVSGNWRDDTQLYMPLRMQRTLQSSHITHSDLDRIFDYVCDELEKNFRGFNRTQITKLTESRDRFYEIADWDTKRQVLRLILQGAHSDGSYKQFSKINGKRGTFGRIDFNVFDTLSPTPKYILFQSPTGLFMQKEPVRFDE